MSDFINQIQCDEWPLPDEWPPCECDKLNSPYVCGFCAYQDGLELDHLNRELAEQTGLIDPPAMHDELDSFTRFMMMMEN